MPTQNLVSATILPADKTAIQAAIQLINSKLLFTISLTNEERKGGIKLGDKSVSFIDKSIGYAQNNPNLVPNYVNLPEAIKDYTLQKDLNDIQQWMVSVVQKIEDTRMEAGLEAFNAMLAFYQAVKVAAAKDVPGARAIYEDLQTRFPGRKTSNTTASAPSHP